MRLSGQGRGGLPGRSRRTLLLARLGAVREEEACTLTAGFWGFFSLMCGYFLLLPTRDEAGVSLGTHNLPKLFVASLLLTLLATPLASAFLSRYAAKELGLQALYRSLSLLVLVFFSLYLLTGAPEVPPAGQQLLAGAQNPKSTHQRALLEQQSPGGGHEWLRSAASAHGQHQAEGAAGAGSAGGAWGALPGKERAGRQLADPAGRPLVEEQQERDLKPAGRQAAQQTAAQQAVAQQAGEEQSRLQATAGAVDEAQADQLRARPGAAALTPAQWVLRVAFFLSVSLLNLVAVSSWWARAADVFTAEAAARLFGILGAGATLGQLVGSLVAAMVVRAPLLRSGSPSSPSLLPLLISASMLAAAGEFAVRFRAQGPATGRPTAGRDEQAEEGLRLDVGAQKGPTLGGRPSARGISWRRTLSSTAEGFRLIRHSPYLRHLCLFLVFNYIISSFFYFEKSLVAATSVSDAATRTAWFATINSASAFCILGLQLVATGPALRRLGVPCALAITPTAAGLLMARIAFSPTPSVVGAAEVVRKVLTYSLARPAREVLFTVVTREEKYAAKIVIDTVVQRCGDVLAAGAFQTLDGALGLGPSGVAAAAVPLCAAWAAVAHTLGRRQEALAARVAQKQQEAGGGSSP